MICYPKQDRIISKFGALTSYQYFLVNNEGLLAKPELYEDRYDSVLNRRHGEVYTVQNPFTGASENYYFACSPTNSTIETCNWAIVMQISPHTVGNAMSEMAQIMNMEYVALVTNQERVFSVMGMGAEAQLRDLLMSEDNLLEAAEIDGCGEAYKFINIVLPLMKPALISLTIFTFINTWGAMFWPMISTTKTERSVLTVALTRMIDPNNAVDYGYVMASNTLAFMPCFILYCILQKQFVEGIALSGVKG